jgi:predicted O-linked N-acetylglucosamine transferase (SPINDLY family)
MYAARELFKVVAIGFEDCTDELTREVFDEFLILDRNLSMIDQLKFIQRQAQTYRAAVCYLPSVGMFPLTMWLANLRVAPLQMMALGHPATTHSDAIDYVVVEEDYVGDPRCFSEKLLTLPPDGMPYRPSASAHGIEVLPKPDSDPDVVYIAVCSTTMKLNPGFLTACARIAKQSKVKVHFQFLIGQNQGLVRPLLTSVVKQYLGEQVTVFPHQDYVRYMDVIAGCHMFINPFPFGNTNGIIDTVSAGLVGVCKTGPEVHEHIDEGLFSRLKLPGWLVAKTVSDYIQASVRLAEDHSLRRSLSKEYAGKRGLKTLFEGHPEIMGQKIYQLSEAVSNKKVA